jgi:hypothetical protein
MKQRKIQIRAAYQRMRWMGMWRANYIAFCSEVCSTIFIELISRIVDEGSVLYVSMQK